MKRSSSSFDQQLANQNDSSYQTSYTKRVRHSPSGFGFNNEENSDYRQQEILMDQRVANKPRHSIILGSFSHPPTYVIHYLDPHLTFCQSFQICSLFGRVRIHGHHLPPYTFLSMHNYRTNSPLAIESISSIVIMAEQLQDIRSMIDDEQLAALALSHVQEKGGDILLIRKEPNNDSIFMKTIREHRMYSHWFSETYDLLEKDQWRQLEKDLHIRWIENTDQNVIVPREQFVLTTDNIITQWLDKAAGAVPFIVLICGEKDMGKSTFTRYLINRALNHISSEYDLTYFDCDIGQCEFTMGGCLSYVNLHSPLLGPPCSHIRSNPKADRMLYYGSVSPQASPIRYLQYINKLRQLWNLDHQNENSKRSMVVINTMGWGTGLGLELLKETICMCSPNVIIQLGESLDPPQDRNKMPDVTLQWLLQQPVFSAYRRKIQMSDRRQEDYDGRLNYEYIKLQSAALAALAAASNTAHSDIPKLRPRDHRLLATWSYFFSSNLSRIHLPWSQFVHVSLLDNSTKNFRQLPDCLKHSIVAFCSSDHIDQWRNSATRINGIFHLSNTQDEVFECLGFGWIERCDKNTQTYEIYTPVVSLSNVNMLVTGAFDTPDEFECMFKRVLIE